MTTKNHPSFNDYTEPGSVGRLMLSGNRPHIHVNVAMTADGKIDSASRQGAVLSSARDGERVDRMRAEVDAVMVGGKTLLEGDPRLTVKSAALRAERIAAGLPENPAKVGVVSLADLSPAARFLTVGPARRLIYTTSRTTPDQIARLEAAGAEVFVTGDDRVDLPTMLASLYNLGIRRMLVEGGGTLLAEFFRLGLVDELTIYVAPLILGGAAAPTLADGLGWLPHQSPRLELLGVEAYDDTGGILIHYRVSF